MTERERTDEIIWDALKPIATRLDKLEAQDWAGLNAHLHTMWHDLERHFDELEAKVGATKGSGTLLAGTLKALDERVEELEKQRSTPHSNLAVPRALFETRYT